VTTAAVNRYRALGNAIPGRSNFTQH